MSLSKIILALSLACITLIAGCASVELTPKLTPSPAKIAITVEKDAWFAAGIEDELKTALMQLLLENGVGQPTEDPNTADLHLTVNVTNGNLTLAEAWKWELKDIRSQTILQANTDSSLLGASGDGVARSVVASVLEIDTARYAQRETPNSSTNTAQRTPRASSPNPYASATDGANAFAVVVGIERYRENLAPATGAEADARLFAEFAMKTLGVPETNIKLLLGERASRADLTGALQEWLPRNAVQPGGKVYVYFSGHGAPDVNTGDAYLVPYDANPTYIKTGGLSMNDLQSTLSALKGQQAFLFLDACFSGSGDRSVIPEGTRPLVPVKKLEPSGQSVTFSASGASETTGAHRSSGHGLFTYHLLNGMAGAADTNKDSNISLEELKRHVTQQVQVEARRDNRDQTPTVTAPANLDLKDTVLINKLEAP